MKRATLASLPCYQLYSKDLSVLEEAFNIVWQFNSATEQMQQRKFTAYTLTCYFAHLIRSKQQCGKNALLEKAGCSGGEEKGYFRQESAIEEAATCSPCYTSG